MPLLLLVLLLIVPQIAFAQGQPVPVELTNPGFENELNGWEAGTTTGLPDVSEKSLANVSSASFRSGKAALHLTPAGPGQWPEVSQKVTSVQPGASYVLKTWYRCGNQPANMAAMRLSFLDAAGKTLASRYVRRPGNDSWLEMGLQMEAPKETTSAVISLRAMGDQEVWFDDIALVKIQDPAPLLVRTSQLVIEPGQATKVTLSVSARAELPEGAQASVTIDVPGGKPIRGTLTRQDAHLLSGEISLPALLPGGYRWQAQFDKVQVGGRLDVSLTKRQPRNLSDRGLLLVEGKPFFPIGIYHAAIGDYPLLAEKGFNAVQGLATQDQQLLRQALEEARRSKLIVDMPLHYGGEVGANLGSSQSKLQALAKSPALLGWKIADEPDLHPETADEVPEAYNRLKSKDNQHPFLLTVDSPETYGYWSHFCDALQVVAFPFPQQSLGLVAERLTQARQALQPWQHLSVLLQAGWQQGARNQPDLGQARAMVYLAVINGAQGIWWYSLRDPGWQLTQTPLWEQFKAINEETALLGGLVTQGQPQSLQNDAPQMQAAAWRLGDVTQVLLVNPTPAALQGHLRLPVAVETAQTVKGEGKIEVKDGALEVSLEPGMAALIAVKTAPPAAK